MPNELWSFRLAKSSPLSKQNCPLAIFFALRNLQGIEFSMELGWVLNKLIANHSNEGGCVVLNVTNYVILLS